MTTHTPTDSDRSLFERVADLPLAIAGSDLDRTDRKLAANFTRTTTVISLHGDGATGSGEVITYGAEDQHALASVFYPNGPNDIAPTGYNDPEPRADLPSSPLAPPVAPEGFGWD